jgi:hydroxymethylpyrimidine/phosphomethylpyrimidine kinase
LRTFQAFGVHGLSALTAVTAQNTRAVRGVFPVAPRVLERQLAALAEDFPIAAVKIGMLGSGAAVEIVARWLERQRCPVVLDPVLVSSSGTSLLPARALGRLRERLLPRATLLTPNLPEAQVLLGRATRAAGSDLAGIAQALRALGAHAVLLKGGHGGEDPIRDLLIDAGGRVRTFRHRRLPFDARGTGCTLASGVAAGLALGLALPEAVARAERHLQRALGRAYRVGRGGTHVPG